MSTEHTLLVERAKSNDPSSINQELSAIENSDRCSLTIFKTHPTITEAFEQEIIARDLDAAQLEQLAVRLLYVASYISPNSLDLLERYNLRFSGDDLNKPVEL